MGYSVFAVCCVAIRRLVVICAEGNNKAELVKFTPSPFTQYIHTLSCYYYDQHLHMRSLLIYTTRYILDISSCGKDKAILSHLTNKGYHTIHHNIKVIPINTMTQPSTLTDHALPTSWREREGEPLPARGCPPPFLSAYELF